MKKKICAAVAAFLIACTVLPVSAAVLTPEQALHRALGSDVHKLPAMSASRYTLAYSIADDVYVFSTDGSFIAVAGDDMAPAVLGYSAADEPFDADNMPPSMKWWLEEYGRQIEAARLYGAAQVVRPDRKAIAPMITTMWNQDAPYNDKCPVIDGEHAVVGCTAVAMAQVMKYHNWPPKGTGSISYADGDRTVSCDFSTITFDWNNMLDNYSTGSPTQAQRDAVAELMFACGASVNMSYNLWGSGGSDYKIPKAARLYFNYDDAVRSYRRDCYGLVEWENLVYSQLTDCGPMVYSGYGSGLGHAFVCDGYSKDGYFHINWGWGGMADTYFLLTALAPTYSGIGGNEGAYNYDQNIIADMRPPRQGSKAVINITMIGGMSVDEPSVSLGSDFTVRASCYNLSSENITGCFGVALRNTTSGAVTYIEDDEVETYEPIHGVTGFILTMPSDMAAGEYILTPAFHLKGGQWVSVNHPLSVVWQYNVKVDGGKADFTPVAGATLRAENIKLLRPLYFGLEFDMTADLVNNSDIEYIGVVVPALLNADGTVASLAESAPVDVFVGETQPFEFTSYFKNGPSTGTYTFVLLDGDTYEPISDGFDVEAKVAGRAQLVSSNFKLVGDDKNADRHNLKFTADIACNAGYYIGKVEVGIIPYNGDSERKFEATFYSDEVIIYDGQSKEIEISGDFVGGELGKKYEVWISLSALANSKLTGDRIIFITLSKTDGVSDVEAPDCDVILSDCALVIEGGRADVSIFTPDGRVVLRADGAEGVVSLDSLQKGIYIVRADFGDNTVTKSIRL